MKLKEKDVMLKQYIEKLANELYRETVANRRHLHENPELSFKEYNTSAFIKKQLTELNIPFEAKADTGILAWVQGTRSSSGEVIALRADIDALPIHEANKTAYRSKNEGIMHACGHDVHTSSLIATATILNKLKDSFSGTVKFIFQPAEERIPGGARQMIGEGALENPTPRYILGQHTMPELPAGKIGIRPGYYMASTDELFIRVTGKGGHAAMPHLNIDPVTISCELISALQQIVSRQANPLIPSVLSFGRIVADGSTNVIPDKVEIEGTFRTLDEEWRAEAHRRMQKLANTLVEGMGGQCAFDIRKGYPVLNNDEQLTHQTREYAIEFLGKDQVVDLDIWMAAEDFAYYSQIIPACFYRLGTGNEAKGITSGLHTPTFDIEEEALKTGSGLMAYLALRLLGTHSEDGK
jgi:amidohydrolase